MLHIDTVTAGYQAGFAIRDVNLEMEPGEIVGVIGPNGCGKTTLLRTISGVLKPRTGRILLGGSDTRAMGVRDLARRLAVVSQGAETAHMTVEDFVLLGRIPYFKKFQFFEKKEDRLIAREAMVLTDTAQLADHPVAQLSGGETQLAFIARALAQQPELLLLDEPTAHLDIAHQVRILDLVRRLNKQFGLTVLMVLHDLNLAAEYCHRLVLMSDGRVHKTGSPDNVLDYRVIEEVYKTVVVVEKNPLSSKPYVLVVSEEQRQRVATGS